MARTQDWPARLQAVIEEARHMGFRWGQHDCALFACACVAAMTGSDPAIDFRGRYRSAAGARRALERHGFANLEQAADGLLGPRRATALHAQRGDLVLIETDNGPALAVCAGRWALAAGDIGVEQIPMDRWLIAWEI